MRRLLMDFPRVSGRFMGLKRYILFQNVSTDFPFYILNVVKDQKD